MTGSWRRFLLARPDEVKTAEPLLAMLRRSLLVDDKGFDPTRCAARCSPKAACPAFPTVQPESPGMAQIILKTRQRYN
jgi:hypothetical protein